jgi:hypothetical protein
MALIEVQHPGQPEVSQPAAATTWVITPHLNVLEFYMPCMWCWSVSKAGAKPRQCPDLHTQMSDTYGWGLSLDIEAAAVCDGGLQQHIGGLQVACSPGKPQSQ